MKSLFIEYRKNSSTTCSKYLIYLLNKNILKERIKNHCFKHRIEGYFVIFRKEIYTSFFIAPGNTFYIYTGRTDTILIQNLL